MVTGSAKPSVYTSELGDSFALCAVGHSLHKYNLMHLRLVWVSGPLPRKIRAVAKARMYDIAAAGGDIYTFQTSRLLWSATHSQHAKVYHLLAKNQVLISAGTDNTVRVWRAQTGEPLQSFTLHHQSTISSISMVHNYGTKLVIGCLQGHLELWNFNTASLVHRFPPYSKNVAVTAIGSASVDDTIAVGLANGTVAGTNLLYGTELFRFRHESPSGANSAVTAVAFRHDKSGTLCSGTDRGEVAVWNLEKQCLEGLLTATVQAKSQDDVFETPHRGRITGLTFLEKDPMLLTSGEDNALRMYGFDRLQGTGSLEKERRGHHAPCTGAMFYDDNVILTRSSDKTLRAFHVLSDLFGKEISQGNILSTARRIKKSTDALRHPPAVCADSSTLRSRDWASLVTGHLGTNRVALWRMDKFCAVAGEQGELAPPPGTDRQATVTAVRISACANYVIVGMSSGRLRCYNLQSTELRCEYKDPQLSEGRAHAGRVVAAHTLADNTALLSAALDTTLRIWAFPPTAESACHLKYRVVLADEAAPVVTAFAPVSSLLATAAGDHTVRVYDADPYHLPGFRKRERGGDAPKRTAVSVVQATAVRTFKGHVNAVTSLAFSPDRRLLVSASLDSTLRFWDLPTDRLIDAVRFPSTVTSVSFHPESHFLATTHANHNGVMLWTNKLKYGHIPKPIEAASAVAATPLFHLPEVAADGVMIGEEEGEEERGSKPEIKLYNAEEPIINFTPQLTETEKKLESFAEGCGNGDLITLGGIARQKWASLPVLEQIRRRNKPIAPPKKINAPFFLPSQEEASKMVAEMAAQARASNSRILSSLKDGAEADETPFVRLLREPDFDRALALLEDIGPAKVEVEIRALCGGARPGELDDESGDRERLSLALRFFAHHLRRKDHFEFVEALLALFGRVHGVALAADPGLREQVAEIAELQKELSTRVQDLVDQSLSLISYLVAPS
eukprot:TRINITY_DN2413_c2_g1_i2.p1 TRINITY_DN2413_c2_g1~~TRINITY_DN2413_c2_g1_i2.p1  ORF type:complete len:1030 (+),score=287.89 TRINITY_DN2413_c2_g1_i2:209-3091(+)